MPPVPALVPSCFSGNLLIRRLFRTPTIVHESGCRWKARWIVFAKIHVPTNHRISFRGNLLLDFERLLGLIAASLPLAQRRIRSDRRRDRARYLPDLERGLHPSRARIHYSAGRVAALLVQPPHCYLPCNASTSTIFCGCARKATAYESWY
jgi:hypothetical protein